MNYTERTLRKDNVHVKKIFFNPRFGGFNGIADKCFNCRNAHAGNNVHASAGFAYGDECW